MMYTDDTETHNLLKAFYESDSYAIGSFVRSVSIDSTSENSSFIFQNYKNVE